MASVLSQFQQGKGTKIYVSRLGSAGRVAPSDITVTVDTGGAAAAAAAIPVTSDLTGDLEASATKPLYLTFVNADGTEVLATITAIAATELTCLALPAAIEAAATATFPLQLLARTAANISSGSSDTTTTTFDTDGYADGLVTGLNYSVSIPGNFLTQDAGWLTCFSAQNEFDEVWLKVELPAPPSGNYTKGFIFEGAATVTTNIDDPADGIITAPIDAVFRGKPTITPPA
jgi:hypothetical protein